MGSQSCSSVPPEPNRGRQLSLPGYRQTPVSESGSVRHAGRVDFQDRSDAASRLAPLVDSAVAALADPPQAITVFAKSPGGTVIGVAVASVLDSSLVNVESAADVAAVAQDLLTDRLVIVVDDGVETGRATFGIGQALRARAVTTLWLAVPVCPRQTEVTLANVYDQVVAVVRPLARRSLRWHYQQF